MQSRLFAASFSLVSLALLAGVADAKPVGVKVGNPPKHGGVDTIRVDQNGQQVGNYAPITISAEQAAYWQSLGMPAGAEAKAAHIAQCINSDQSMQAHGVTATPVGTQVQITGDPEVVGIQYNNSTGELTDSVDVIERDAQDDTDAVRIGIDGTITGETALGGTALVHAGSGVDMVELETGDYADLESLQIALRNELVFAGFAATLNVDGSISYELDPELDEGGVMGTDDEGLESFVEVLD